MILNYYIHIIKQCLIFLVNDEVNIDSQIIDRICANCKYHVKHYIILGKYLTTTRGHCHHEKIKLKSNYSEERFDNKCPYWEATENTPQKTKETVENVIRQMNDRLEALLLILTAKDE